MMKQNHIFILAFLITILLGVAGCHAEIAQQFNEPTLTPTPSIKPTRTATITRTKITTHWPTRTVTPTKTITNTPTSTTNPKDFDASTIKTITVGPSPQAPEINPGIEISPEKLVIYDDRYNEHHLNSLDLDNIIDYLNQGVPLNTIIAAIQNNEEYKSLLSTYKMEDLTGDGVDEWVFPHQFGVAIIGYPNNQYEVLEIFHGYDVIMRLNSFDTIDLNGDGIKEIAVEQSGCLMGNCPRFYVFSWDGDDFSALSDFNCSTTSQFPFTVDFRDTDYNGTKEIILFHKAIWNYIPYFDVFPDRDETVICMWNGNQFIPSDNYLSDPVYRLQAYNDAISSANRKEYDEAIELFLRVIHDETLLWYIPGRDMPSSLSWANALEYTSTLEPNIIYDPMFNMEFNRDIYEYPLLASASYYRLMLIYIQQGDMKNAETMLVVLKDAYPPGSVGGFFTQLAKIVLTNYKNTNDITQSCIEGADFITKNWDKMDRILTYLQITDFYFGRNSLCPYLPEGYGEE